MKLLVAATGTGPGDFAYAVPGELVMLGLVCDRDRYAWQDGQRDGGCGCGRAFAGLSTDRATTLALVSDVDVTEEQLVEIVGDAIARGGMWGTNAHAIAADMIAAGADFDLGARVRCNVDEIYGECTHEHA